LVLIVVVMGVIYLGLGMCTTTEASEVHAIRNIFFCVINRRLTWRSLESAVYNTLSIAVIAIWIVVETQCFTGVHIACKASQFIISPVIGLDIPTLTVAA